MINTNKIAAMALVKDLGGLHLKDNYSNIKEMREDLEACRVMALQYLTKAVEYRKQHPEADTKDVNYFSNIINNICNIFRALVLYQYNGGRYIVRF